MFSGDTNLLDNIRIENVVKPENLSTGNSEVSTDVPQAVIDYKAPEAISDNPTDFAFSFDDMLISLPTPVSVFTANGWEISKDESKEVIAGNDNGRITMYKDNKKLTAELSTLISAMHAKAKEFANVLKMGRTQLQDAVPMTLGQEFESYAAALESEIPQIMFAEKNLHTINMGATAIGTGINSDPLYTPKVTEHLSKISGFKLKAAKNLIAATNDTTDFVTYSSQLKRLAVKVSKICSDLRILSSGPRTGFFDISLPPMQPGSSIMPGKVNPVIPEVVNQACFRVIGNDTAVMMASEAGQLELNVFEPIIVYSIFESIRLLINGMKTLRERCVCGIVGNYEHCKESVHRSISIVTALNPVIGYEASSDIAKTALQDNRSVYDIVLERGLLLKEKLDEVLKPENMTKPKKMK